MYAQLNAAIQEIDKRRRAIHVSIKLSEDVQNNSINWLLILEAASAILLLVKEYFFKDGKYKKPSVFKWPAIVIGVYTIARNLVNALT